LDLGEEALGAFDGACDKLWEVGNVDGVVDDVVDGGLFFAVDIDGVGHGLEGVEADADGENDVERGE